MTQTLGPALFQRAISLNVNGTLLSALDCAFKIKKNLKNEPNTCDLRIYNLSTDTRKTFEAATTPTASTGSTNAPAKIVPCILSAGYVNAMSTIFSGELRAAQTSQDGATQVTELSTGDGDAAIAQSRLTIALGAGSSAAQGLRTILTALGIGQGNLASALTLIQANPALAQMFVKGVVLKGSAADLMTHFCQAAGLEWSIQDGALQILNLGQPLPGQSYVISSLTGMEGSPSVDTKGILSVKTRLIPGILPGVVIVIQGKYVTGNYRVISCEYIGGTREKNWTINIEADLF